MTFKTILALALKILGIYILIQGILSIPQTLGIISIYQNEDMQSQGFYYLISTLISFGLYILVAWFLLLKTDIIIDKIATKDIQDLGFDNVKIHRSILLSICIIIIGGLTLINEIPNFLRILYGYIAENKYNHDARFDYVLMSGSKILIAIYLINYNRMIVNWIEKKREKIK